MTPNAEDTTRGFRTKIFANPRFDFSQPKDSNAGIEKPTPKGKPALYTRAQVAEHTSRTDAWFIIHDKVYDLSKFLPRHPGGYTLMAQAGGEATPEFEAYHPPYVTKYMLRSFYIGDIVPEEQREGPGSDSGSSKYAMTELEADFAKLRQEVHSKYLETDWSYYYIKFGFVALFFVITALLVLNTQSLALTALAGLTMFLTWHQAAFIGHDTLHNSVAETHNMSGILGAICTNLINGTSASWWRWSHDVHHLNTNSADHDLDITHLPFFCLSEKMFGYKQFDFVAKIMVPLQAYAYMPIMMLFARPNLHVQTIIFLISQRGAIPAVVELAFVALYWAYYGLFIYSLPDWSHRAVFMFISYVFVGMLHMQITLSHWSLPMHEGVSKKPFVQAQAETCQNLRTYWWNDWFYGGLNYQFEHHLFPRVPRNNLRTIRNRYLLEFCKRHNLPYHEVGFIEGVGLLLGALSRVSSNYLKSIE